MLILLEFPPPPLPFPAPWLYVNTQQKCHLQEILPITVLSVLASPTLISLILSLTLPFAPCSFLSLHCARGSQMGFFPPALD